MESESATSSNGLKALLIISSEKYLYSSIQQPNGSNDSVVEKSSEILAESGVSLSLLEFVYAHLTSLDISVTISTPTGNPPALSDVDTQALQKYADGAESERFSVDLNGKTSNRTISQEDANLCDKQDASNKRTILQLYRQLIKPVALRNCVLCSFHGVLIPHHIGAAIELVCSTGVGSAISSFQIAGKPICAIGYGVFALLARHPSTDQTRAGSIKSSPTSRIPDNHLSLISNDITKTSESGSGFNFTSGSKSNTLFFSFRMTGVSLEDEVRYPFFGHLPQFLQEQVEEEGGVFVSFSPDTPGCVVDRNLITGSNEISTAICLQNFCFLCSRNNNAKQSIENMNVMN